MKKHGWTVLLVLTALAISMSFGMALAQDKIFVKGIIVEYDLDERTVTVDVDSEEMTFVIESDVALLKLDDRLFEGDEVKVKYVVEDGKMIIKEATDMRGTKPGC